MQRFISFGVIGLMLTFGLPIMAVAGDESVPRSPPVSEMGTDPSGPDEQGVQSRGSFPKIPSYESPFPLTLPQGQNMRPLSRSEKELARMLFGDTINYEMVALTDKIHPIIIGAPKPTMTTTPPNAMLNVGPDFFPSLIGNDDGKRLLIHLLTHVWHFQRLFPSNTTFHQSYNVISNGGIVANLLGNFTVGKSWYSERGSVVRETWLCSGGNVL